MSSEDAKQGEQGINATGIEPYAPCFIPVALLSQPEAVRAPQLHVRECQASFRAICVFLFSSFSSSCCPSPPGSLESLSASCTNAQGRASTLCKGRHSAARAAWGWGQPDAHQGLHQQTLDFSSLESVCSGSSSIASAPSAKFKILHIPQALISTFSCNPQSMTHLTSLQLFLTPVEGRAPTGGGGGEGCPLHPPARRLHTHERDSEAAACPAAPTRDAAPSSPSCRHSGSCRWDRWKPQGRPLPRGGPVRCWGEPGATCRLSVGFSLQRRWKLAHQLISEPAHPSRFTCGGLRGI